MAYVSARPRRARPDPRQLELPFETALASHRSLLAPSDPGSLVAHRRRWAMRAGVRPGLAGLIAGLALGDGEAR